MLFCGLSLPRSKRSRRPTRSTPEQSTNATNATAASSANEPVEAISTINAMYYRPRAIERYTEDILTRLVYEKGRFLPIAAQHRYGTQYQSGTSDVFQGDAEREFLNATSQAYSSHSDIMKKVETLASEMADKVQKIAGAKGLKERDWPRFKWAIEVQRHLDDTSTNVTVSLSDIEFNPFGPNFQLPTKSQSLGPVNIPDPEYQDSGWLSSFAETGYDNRGISLSE
ncbi:uncharacterized protein IL334_001422 [Kwoniella shivajii]|uniref:Uncharacterized protein n=1 Tax=Kwoniella shivajii TaxID=564305 RepID=A0ABZ1CTF8_9TREE|nr:hypothetical protein IL334_001422 [Kwoniella shivajii]